MSERGAFDVVVIGSGMNSLVCAALLALDGRRVCVLERERVAGGCVRTEPLTVPGFLHDTLSTLYPLFVTAPHFARLAPELERRGVRFLNGAAPTAVVTDDGRWVTFGRDREDNARRLDAEAAGDGERYRDAMAEIEADASLLFGLLGAELFSFATTRLMVRELWRRGVRGLARFFGGSLESSRDWLDRSFRSELVKALIAPWVLHVGLGPESAMSARMNKLILFTLEQAGSPMIEGGSARIVEAFGSIISEAGGAVRCGCDVSRVLVRKGKSAGVRLADGQEILARSAVVANVTPTQLYERLLPFDDVPAQALADARAYRYGRGEMQIHLALDERPQWPDARLGDVAMLHVTGGLDSVSKAVNEAERGLLPAEATIVVAQPAAVDPSRAPAGKWILWIQLQELPRNGALKGDALDEIAVPADGRWSEPVREAYADRIVARLSRLIPNLQRSILARNVIGPADLEALNINLVGGDPYSGSCAIDQFMLWRPARAGRNHETPIARLYHIGASTHPGPGLGGMSGYMAAQHILRGR